MALSGSTDFTRTRNEIIVRALRIINAVGQGQTPTAAQISEAAEALNAIVKQWQTEGIRLWTTEWVTQTFTASNKVTGTDSKVYTCFRSHTSAAANRPITGADYTTYWKQTGTGGSGWVTATAYKSIADFDFAVDTIYIEKAFLRRDGTDHIVWIQDLPYYANIPDKTLTGFPDYLIFDPKIPQHKAYLYPVPDDTSDVLHYLRIKKLQDFDASTNDPDFYADWIDPLTFGLAHRLSYEYGLPPQERSQLRDEAELMKQRSRHRDRRIESESFVEPAFEEGRRGGLY